MPILVKREHNHAVLTLSNPTKRNAWETSSSAEIRGYLSEFEEDPSISCVILTGDPEGKAFTAGVDSTDKSVHALEGMAEFLHSLRKSRTSGTFTTISAFPKPLIAAVNGYAVGVGAILSFCCDLVVAGRSAEWRLPQAALGIMPTEAGVVRLAQFVGKGNAMKMALGFPMKAEQAYACGLAQWLVDDDELMSTASSIAGSIANLAPLSVQMIKESMSSGSDMPLQYAALADRYRSAALLMTQDKLEGHRAWREKGKPKFQGK